MTASTISQIFNNAPALAQTGFDPVAQAKVEFSGGDALLGFSGSAWTQSPGPISLAVWVDNQPVGGELSIYANAAAMHMSLGRTWIWCQGMTPGTHEVAVMAGQNTMTDANDRVSLTLWEVGDGVVVREVTDSPCPSGTGQVLLATDVGLHGGALLLSGSTSGWVTQAGGMVAAAMLFEGGDALISQVLANNANQHLATVPVDLVFPDSRRGQQEVQLNAMSNTTTDSGDYAHLGVVEWVNPADAPVVLDLNPYLQDEPAAQQGGGDYIAQAKFQSSGGPLLFRTNLSAWTTQVNSFLQASIEIDGNPLGSTELYTNVSNTHLTLVSNDFVATGVAAGNHTLYLQAGVSTVTDGNDRVSVQVLEFPKS